MNKLAVITGASRGIGKTCSLQFAALGYQTVLIARNELKLKQIAEEIRISKPEVPNPFLLAINITDQKSIESGIQKVIEKFGRIDVLVNNAGIYLEGTSELSIENFEEQLNTNLTAAFGLIKNIVPIMKKQKQGYIFNIASRAGKVGFAESGGYSASKFGLVGLSESLFRELAGFGISVTAICPGWVDTEMAYEAGTLLEATEMIQTLDIFKAMEWLLNLSPNARVKELIIESAKSIH
ncbi:MAG: SDR family oxidoreductase [Mariniphaga sp.]|nr:SDR family oxidoreductase [Mariniphaga sp.]